MCISCKGQRGRHFFSLSHMFVDNSPTVFMKSYNITNSMNNIDYKPIGPQGKYIHHDHTPAIAGGVRVPCAAVKFQ